MATTIEPRTLKSEIESGKRYQIIDVRSPQEYTDGHIPCAVNLPMDEVEDRLQDLNFRDPVVLVCHSGSRADMTCERLSHHRDDLLVLSGGTSAWLEAGLPVVGNARARLPLMRQVQVVVGPLVILGSVLAIVVDPRWSLLSLAIGAGLTLAGTTGWCGMAVLLGKMPWNRSKTAKRPPNASCYNG